VNVAFDPANSLGTTHESQGSDMGLCGGVLSREPDHERLMGSATATKEAGIRVTFEIRRLGTTRSNTYQLWLKGGKEIHEMVALSTGGGII
jgi:L-serine dehydratase